MWWFRNTHDICEKDFINEVKTKIIKRCSDIQEIINIESKNIIEHLQNELILFSKESQIKRINELAKLCDNWTEDYLKKQIGSIVNSTLDDRLNYSDKEKECLDIFRINDATEKLKQTNFFIDKVVQQYKKTVLDDFLTLTIKERVFLRLQDILKERKADNQSRIEEIKKEKKNLTSTMENHAIYARQTRALKTLLSHCIESTDADRKALSEKIKTHYNRMRKKHNVI